MGGRRLVVFRWVVEVWPTSYRLPMKKKCVGFENNTTEKNSCSQSLDDSINLRKSLLHTAMQAVVDIRAIPETICNKLLPL